MCRSALAELARVDWHTVGGICARVEASLEEADGRGRLDGLRRIGVDETSYKRGQRYMTVVVDHDRGRVVWACRGHGKGRLNEFLDLLTDEQREAIEVVTADGARWIADAVAERLPRAELAVDPFHAVSWATEALDALRCVPSSKNRQIRLSNFDTLMLTASGRAGAVAAGPPAA